MINSAVQFRKPNAAYYFDGGTEQHFDVPDSKVGATIQSGEFTCTAFVRRVGFGTNQTVMAQWAGSGQKAFQLRFLTTDALNLQVSDNGTTQVTVNTTETYTGSDYLVIDLVVSLSESTAADRCKVYVNGVLQTLSGSWPSSINNSNQPLTFGGRGSASATIEGFMATGCCLLDTPLTASQVADKYNSGTPFYVFRALKDNVITFPDLTTAYWDTSSYTCIDQVDAGTISSSGLGTGDFFPRAGIYEPNIGVDRNQSFDFDGVNDHITFPAALKTYMNDLQFTVLIAMKKEGTGAAQALLGDWTSGTNDRIITIQFNSAEALQVSLSGDGTTAVQAAFASTGITTNQWHALAIVVDWTESSDSDKVKLYTDGSARTITTTPSGGSISSLHTSSNSLYIGDRNPAATPFEGIINQVVIVDSALTASEVADWANLGEPLPAQFITDFTPVFYMDVDGSTFSTNWTVPDGVNSNDGTSANMDSADRVADNPYK